MGFWKKFLGAKSDEENETRGKQTPPRRASSAAGSLGGPGPNGGIIFYLDDSGLHGLEANSEDSGCVMWTKAGEALSRTGGGRLPTVQELQLLIKMRDLVGGFENGHYWSTDRYPESKILCWAVVCPWGNTSELRAYQDSRGGVDGAYVRGVHDF